jgi:nucleotidyltransferase substrate binding protein (TIGR01987 family)
LIRQLNDYLLERKIGEFNNLEQSGLKTQFQLSFDLMWKLLRDYLDDQETEIGLISPKNVLRVAASSVLLEKIGVSGEILMNALLARNELVHIYDYENAQDVLEKIQTIFVPEMKEVERYFDEK